MLVHRTCLRNALLKCASVFDCNKKSRDARSTYNENDELTTTATATATNIKKNLFDLCRDCFLSRFQQLCIGKYGPTLNWKWKSIQLSGSQINSHQMMTVNCRFAKFYKYWSIFEHSPHAHPSEQWEWRRRWEKSMKLIISLQIPFRARHNW